MPRLVAALALACSVVAGGCGRPREPFHVSAASEATRRSLPAGDVIGGAGRYGAHAWLGIPFAQPPVGELRWRAPQPLPPWSGVRQALAFGPACPQFGSRFGGLEDVAAGSVGGTEDCLTLNVWAPPFAPDAVPRPGRRLPVMVWIHGGGNSIGHAFFYEGGNLAVTQQVIVVAVQYRLGPFGWFNHEALRQHAGSDRDRSGNFGTLDLVRALEWVRDNIGAFGGDPANVTVFGESAGGQNVFSLLLAPPAHGLFQRAIVESGGFWTSSFEAGEHLTDDAVPGDAQSSGEILLRLLVRDGRAADRAAARAVAAGMTPDAVAAYLRSQSTAQLLSAYEPLPSGMIDMPKLFTDGAVLPAGDPLKLFARADGWNRVPVILGTNRDEMALFLFADPDRIHKLLGFLPRFVDEPWYRASVDYSARLWKATGVDEPAAAMRTVSDRVFAYRFDWDEEPTVFGAELPKMLGASHAFEIPFVFGHFDLGREGSRIFTTENEPGRQSLSRAMMAYWAAFARTGDPANGGLADVPQWTAWDAAAPDRPKYVVLDTPEGGGIRMANATQSRAGVIAALMADASLSERDRCRVLHELADRRRGAGRDDYAAQPACAAFPFEKYPWSS